MGDRLYLDARELPDRAQHLIEGLKLNDTLLIAIPGKLLVAGPTGELIERIDSAEGVPGGMNRIGLTASGQLVIRGACGDYLTDLEKLDWRKSTTATRVGQRRSRYLRNFISSSCKPIAAAAYPLERVILAKLELHKTDLHSGRIGGQWGVYVVDGAALLFLALVITGLDVDETTRMKIYGSFPAMSMRLKCKGSDSRIVMSSKVGPYGPTSYVPA